MSPRPRVSQPGTSATLRPASKSAFGNQVNENGIALSATRPASTRLDAADGMRQVFVARGVAVLELDVAAVDVTFVIVRLRWRDGRSFRTSSLLGVRRGGCHVRPQRLLPTA